MDESSCSFLYFIISKRNRGYLLFALLTGIVYFITLRHLYPVPSYYADSFTWIGAAKTLQPVTFRPVGYSKLLYFFKFFSVSDIALIAGQFFCNLLVNLFLFYTCTWFFRLRKVYKTVLYLLLVINPFYLFYSNYISSDAFFNCFTVLWFTLLIWILHRPKSLFLIAQLVLLAGLFFLRYNAVFFPVISTLAILLTNLVWWKKAVYISLGCMVIASIIVFTTVETKKFTGTETFSAFSGWQLANNALHVVQHSKIDTTNIKDKEVKALVNYTVRFFDTARQTFPDSAASAVFMWHINSPLKNYMKVYPGKKKTYFATWNALGPLYSKFGKTIILQKPLSYINHFVIPNTKAYFSPGLEIYDTYFEKSDTIAAIAQQFYHYKSNKVPVHHPVVYAIAFKPVQYLFTLINFLFLPLLLYYWLSKKYKKQSLLFNQMLLVFTAFYIANFFFIVLLAPTVIRYHISILTLSFPVLIYLLQHVSGRNKIREPWNSSADYSINDN